MNNKQTIESFPFIVYKGCIYSYNSEVPEGATILNAPNIDTATGYVSEDYHNEMLAEKEKEIEELKEAISLRDGLIEAYRDRHESASKLIDLVK